MSTQKKSLVSHYLDRANAFYRHVRWGREALPVMDEDVPAGSDAEHFGIPVKFVSVGAAPFPDGPIIPVVPWGAHVLPVDC